MGCDRNLFTLRLVLNQTRGEWQWQAAAQGWGRRGKWITEKQRGYATLHGSSITPSAGHGGVSSQALRTGRGKRTRSARGMSDVPVTGQPPWNDYEAVQRAAVNHPSTIHSPPPPSPRQAAETASNRRQNKSLFQNCLRFSSLTAL